MASHELLRYGGSDFFWNALHPPLRLKNHILPAKMRLRSGERFLRLINRSLAAVSRRRKTVDDISGDILHVFRSNTLGERLRNHYFSNLLIMRIIQK